MTFILVILISLYLVGFLPTLILIIATAILFFFYFIILSLKENQQFAKEVDAVIRETELEKSRNVVPRAGESERKIL